jgi:hypothetical protein
MGRLGLRRIRLRGTGRWLTATLVFAAAGCSGSARGPSSPLGGHRSGPGTTASSTTTTTQTTSSVLPVVSCPTTYGVDLNTKPFVPHQLPTSTIVGGLSFYSNGRLTVLGPAGWVCSALVAADGGQSLDVYPAGEPDLSTGEVSPGTPVVQVVGEWTGHGPGAQLICPLFPASAAVTFLNGAPPCPTIPSGERIIRSTDDVVRFEDPAGLRGSGAGSGGPLVSRGAAVYPQMNPEPAGGVTVAILSCTLPPAQAGLCDGIEADFVVRNAPAYDGTTR